MMKRQELKLAIGAFALAITTVGAQAAVVLSNNVVPGDTFSNAGGSNQGQAVGATG